MLECDRGTEAVDAFRSAVDAELRRERRWAQLMVALYRDGRQADAFRQYERVRRLLRNELGTCPPNAP